MTAGFEVGHVAQTRLFSPRIKNVTIAAASLADVTFEPGADITLRLPAGSGAPEERRYSVWRSATPPSTFDVCVVLHGHGPGSRWAERCAVGDRIEFARSRTPPIALDPVASTHLFLGDETSIAATEALVRALPERVSVLACFEVDALAQRWPEAELLRPGSVCWVERAGRPGTALLSWLARESLRDAPSTTAYVTGEAWLCTLVLSHLVRERGIRASAVRALPYWRQRAHAS